VALALDEEPDFPRALAKDLQERRDLLVDGLRAAGLTAYVPQGTYFATASVHELGWPDGMAFCLALPERSGVVAIPEQVFYDDQADPAGGRDLVRFAFCKTREVIADGVARLAAADLHA
jgi:N-succinyldiaminopimelate aminotransferase